MFLSTARGQKASVSEQGACALWQKWHLEGRLSCHLIHVIEAERNQDGGTCSHTSCHSQNETGLCPWREERKGAESGVMSR